jgi:hypothetical protein
MKIKLEELFQALEYIRSINSVPLEDLEIEYQQQLLTIPQKSIDVWKFVGLNNVDLFKGISDLNYLEVQEYLNQIFHNREA